MKLIFAFLLIVLIVFSGYHLSFRRFRIPLFARGFYLTGMEFLFLGLLLGPGFLNVLDAGTMAGLAPVSALVLGWIGMLFGFQFEVAKLRRFFGGYFLAGMTEAFVSFAVVFCCVYLVCSLISDGPVAASVIFSIVGGAAAACTAQTGLALVPSRNATSRQSALIKTLRYFSSVDGLLALLVVTPVSIFSLRSADMGFRRFVFGYDLVIGVIFFAAVMTLYNLFLTHRRERNELALIIIGMVIFISGFSWIMNFSPLLANFYAGACLVNLTAEKEKIFHTLISIEKPLYLLLLVLLGSEWRVPIPWGMWAAAGYFLFRFLGKLTGGFCVSLMTSKRKDLSPGMGLGLMGQGGLPLAILYDFYQGTDIAGAGEMVGVAVTAVVISEILNPYFIGWLLKKE